MFLSPHHNFLINEAYFLTNYPFVPRGLSSLISSKNLLVMKYSDNWYVLDKHYVPLFMKHVLPKLAKPVTPLTDWLV